jgi:hypothetical protein
MWDACSALNRCAARQRALAFPFLVLEKKLTEFRRPDDRAFL